MNAFRSLQDRQNERPTAKPAIIRAARKPRATATRTQSLGRLDSWSQSDAVYYGTSAHDMRHDLNGAARWTFANSNTSDMATRG